MPEETFQVGDIVQLKSGGPKMTVEFVGGSAFGGGTIVQCKWFDEKNKLMTSDFQPGSLKKVADQ